MKRTVSGLHAGAAIGAFLSAALMLLSPTQAANDETAQVSVGASTTLELDSNPSTGYSWVLDAGASQNIELVSVEDLGHAAAAAEPGKRPVLGAPKKQKFQVTGVAAGEAKLVFGYVRAGQDEPAKTLEFVVEVIGANSE